MKKVLLIVLLIMLASPVKALALTKTNRDQMITIAGPYTKVPWRVNKTNSKYPEFSTSGKQIYGMSYSFGDKVKIGTNSLGGTFLKEITSGLMPRNWAVSKSNWTPAKPVSETTGIDCSGFISWVLSSFKNGVQY